MNYLLDRKSKNRNFTRWVILAIVFVFLFYFRMGVFRILSKVTHVVFRPVVIVGNKLGGGFSKINIFFVSKNTLIVENQNLRNQLSEKNGETANYSSVLNENISLKEILNRKKTSNEMILGSILSKPSQSLYDTLVLDIGSGDGVEVGDQVFAFGDIPLGYVKEVHNSTSKVVLFSTSGEKTTVVVSVVNREPDPELNNTEKSISVEAIGRGGGNFEIVLPRDLTVNKGDTVVLPGIIPFVLAKVENVISDPRDPITKILLVSPVNVQEIKFVQIEK
jgi:cell shape-determining protein MreC